MSFTIQKVGKFPKLKLKRIYNTKDDLKNKYKLNSMSFPRNLVAGVNLKNLKNKWTVRFRILSFVLKHDKLSSLYNFNMII